MAVGANSGQLWQEQPALMPNEHCPVRGVQLLAGVLWALGRLLQQVEDVGDASVEFCKTRSPGRSPFWLCRIWTIWFRLLFFASGGRPRPKSVCPCRRREKKPATTPLARSRGAVSKGRRVPAPEDGCVNVGTRRLPATHASDLSAGAQGRKRILHPPGPSQKLQPTQT